MLRITHLNKHIVAALLASVWFSGPVLSQETLVDDLLRQLREAEPGQSARIEEAIRTEWSKSGSATIDLLFRRGQDAMAEGAFDIAVEHFTAAIDHDPSYASGYSGRANAYYRLGYIGPALDDLQHVLVLNPENFVALRGLGVILEEVGRYDEALAAYQAVLALHPNEENALQAVERIQAETQGEAI
ncbi:tetratricopeptide repeat protein [Ponticoccus sp. SC2-23]|uniref:tetratricopeptide repeat protein n=1 Tax=Alexandriicola marinus TaxID=2081710 RepID=UPI000FD78AB5|nr:tetratricopeptide repeat protein [Alexandriicola marinus]MBM1221068.1 tetratricopeptide repeat protein [Ponticoccus sp. SC6-9]MBM1225638.1 tetratricopeptide repeat protein [Ponticoccus sp. SC6-15]MBM1227790.1 tetratricopeptide repeat protein [Ponticoccus sp. SC6-38]MBM1234572.1 tetratricopeptide repeat protein [Ponticoccus sp. SC6-45]MBM1238292.1 tetratricopeptide repeat protein [Ponticoccus sp. SC6-49]MBM1243561.1 tetratricopeptide repeat protein [Ponticoccus sp. SC2-64]MBM1248096.1 tetr